MSFLSRIEVNTRDKCSCNEDEVAKKVIGIIEIKYAAELDLKLISEEIHLTPYYIGSIFKKHTGKQFNQYLNDYRIDKAREMLQSSKIKYVIWQRQWVYKIPPTFACFSRTGLV